ncbi:MAG: hypothetical protein IPL92_12170 [Saprospiraceae bacterium]|nr:hypothetical protein [Candidatus Opimibacter iunctus]
MFGLNEADFISSQMEWLVMIKGYNLSATQHIHVRSSYTTKELVWNAKFKIPHYIREDGTTIFELDKIDDFEEIPASEAGKN